MGGTGFSSFEATEEKTNRILREIEETYQLGAQLPMLVRGIYYSGWDPGKVPMKMSRDTFMQRVREHLVRTVLQALRHYITDGEWDDIKSVLPDERVGALP
jgi:uncharacterized protein (DUF2267 family)